MSSTHSPCLSRFEAKQKFMRDNPDADPDSYEDEDEDLSANTYEQSAAPRAGGRGALEGSPGVQN